MELINSSHTHKSVTNINDLPLSVKLKLLALKHIQTKIQKLNNEFQTEVTEVLQKYHAQTDTITHNSNEVIEAKIMPNLENTPNLGDYFYSSEIIRAQEIPLTSKPFTNYWFTVLMNSKLQVAILPEEEEILLSLERVLMTTSVSKREKKYKLSFVFKENTFFSNKEVICNIKYDRDNNLLEAKSNKINWHPNQSIYKSNSKYLTAAGGFFKLFKRFDKNGQNELLRKYRIDISFIASELIHEIIPNSMHFYLGIHKSKASGKNKGSMEAKQSQNNNIIEENILAQLDNDEGKNDEWIPSFKQN